jgi:hypothetical protein
MDSLHIHVIMFEGMADIFLTFYLGVFPNLLAVFFTGTCKIKTDRNLLPRVILCLNLFLRTRTYTLLSLSCKLGREFGMRLIKSTLSRETRGGGLKAGGEGKTQGCQGGQRDSLGATWDRGGRFLSLLEGAK